MISLAFRLDDPSPVSKLHVETGVLKVLGERRLPATFAVVPMPIESNKDIRFTRVRASHIQEGLQSGLLEVALHGCSHRDNGLDKQGLSEFFGLPLEQQHLLIKQGKQELEGLFGLEITGFVPPWNSYDAQTLAAMQANGLEYISADLREPPKSNLPNLPMTCHLQNLKSSIEHSRRFSRFEPIIIAVIHHYDFDRDDDDPPREVLSYESFGGLLDWVLDQPDVQIRTLRDISERLKGVSLPWPAHTRWRSKLPYRFKHWLPDNFLLSKPLRSRLFNASIR